MPGINKERFMKMTWASSIIAATRYTGDGNVIQDHLHNWESGVLEQK